MIMELLAAMKEEFAGFSDSDKIRIKDCKNTRHNQDKGAVSGYDNINR